MPALPRLALVTLTVGLASCADPAPATTDSAPTAEPVPAAPAEKRLPSDLTGTFDTSQDACTETTTMARLVVSPDSLRFYYGYATIDGVTRSGTGVDVRATLVQQEGQVEVVPEPAAYRIEPGADGGIRFGNEGTEQPAEALVRCR